MVEFDTAYTPWGHLLWQAFIATRLNLPLPTLPDTHLSEPQACPVRNWQRPQDSRGHHRAACTAKLHGCRQQLHDNMRDWIIFQSGRRVSRHHTTTSHSTMTELTATVLTQSSHSDELVRIL